VPVRHPFRVLATFAALLTAPMLVLASSATAAGPCTNEASPGFRSYLPDCRAYEMVTPPYKESSTFESHGMSGDGLQLRVESLGNFLTPEGRLPEGTGVLAHVYRLVRGEAGWRSVPVDAPFSLFPNIEVPILSPDFQSSLWLANAPGQSAAAVYLGLSGGPARMGPGAPPGVLETTVNPVGASKDLLHALFVVHSPNVGLEEARLWPGDTTLGERRPSLYEYAGTGNSEPELVGVKNQGSVAEAAHAEGKSHINEAAELISDCGTVLGSLPEGDGYNAVSESGSTVFFSSEGCGGGPPVSELYARVGEAKEKRTIAISEPPLELPGRECTLTCVTAESVPGNRRPGIFAGASLDGSKAFFTSSQPLMNGDTDGGVDLYEADIADGAVRRLVQVSRGGAGDPTPGSGAEVLGVARVSEDGSHVYFVARGVLTGANTEGKSPLASQPNLYVSVRECPGGGSSCADPVEHTSFVATLSGADAGDWGPQDKRPVQATPDGRFLVFQSKAGLTPDQGEQPEAGQVFEYDAQAEALVRVSRGQDGFNEDGNSSLYAATIPIQNHETGLPDSRFTSLAMSADGSRVFFSSADALSQQALEGVLNVYEYHAGEVALISDGHDVTVVRGGSATELIGTDESGSDVFFTSADRLLAQDLDTWVDVYDARSGGGFLPAAASTQCSGDSCQGAAAAPPQLLAPGVASGSGEAAPAASPKLKVKVKKKSKRSRKAKKRKRSKQKHGRSQDNKATARRM
jgi:hypothetical protein